MMWPVLVLVLILFVALVALENMESDVVKYQGLIKKSRTYDLAAFMGVLSAAQTSLPMVQDQLGDAYGWIMLAASVLMAHLRKTTTGPVGVK